MTRSERYRVVEVHALDRAQVRELGAADRDLLVREARSTARSPVLTGVTREVEAERSPSRAARIDGSVADLAAGL
jgi:hypothetical protein